MTAAVSAGVDVASIHAVTLSVSDRRDSAGSGSGVPLGVPLEVRPTGVPQVCSGRSGTHRAADLHVRADVLVQGEDAIAGAVEELVRHGHR